MRHEKGYSEAHVLASCYDLWYSNLKWRLCHPSFRVLRGLKEAVYMSGVIWPDM